MHNVLITGSNGFLGQKLVDLLTSQAAYEVYAVSRHENINPHVGDYQFTQLDLLDSAALNDYLTATRPAYIIHTAAITSVEACEEDPITCQKMNVDLVGQLADYCKQHAAFFVQLSTDFVFDGQQADYKEDDLPNPLSAYGRSKWHAEQAIAASNCAYAVLRTILVYGINANVNRSNLVLWAKEKLSQKESIHVVNNQWRMPTFVDDLAEACLLAIQKRVTGIFHISGEELLTIVDVVYEVAAYWNLDKSLIQEVTAEDINQAQNRPRITGFNLSKSKLVLGYRPTTFVESLKIIDKQYEQFR